MTGYKRQVECAGLAAEISRLAEMAQQRLPFDSVPWNEAIRRTKQPIDYMRCAEFPAVLEYVTLEPDQRILDVSSPQWLSLYLAHRHPDVEFTYVNISQAELAAVHDTAAVLGLKNIRYEQQDAKDLELADCSFDGCLSVSVIEHIEPEVGGDVLALQGIRRVLRPGANVWLTVPLKDEARVLESSRPSYEGQSPNAQGRYFFAREYSGQSWAQVVGRVGLIPQRQTYILEKPGPLAIDYWAYGPRHSSAYGRTITSFVKVLTRFKAASWQKILAHRQLRLSDQPGQRLANLAGHYCVPA